MFLYTDGGSRGNPGPGGWGAILVNHEDQAVWSICGKCPKTTNNIMELTAVICGLERLEEGEEVTVCTDSMYVKNGITQWVHNWKRNNWTTAKGTPVKNKDLWVQLDALVQTRSVIFKWVKGHAGNKWNEKVDQLTR